MSFYRVLAAIELRHRYFADGRCPGLRWQPLPDTRRWLDQHATLLRQTDRGLLLLHDTQSPAPLAPATLCFSVQAGDPLFANYTAAPLAGPSLEGPAMLFFDHEGAGDGPLQATWHPELAADPAWQAVTRSGPPACGVRLLLDAARLASVPPEGWRYSCELQARATIWKYCLVGRWRDDDTQQLQVVDLARDGTRFEPSGPASLPQGGQAITFRSTAPIPLQQRPAQRLQLRRQGPGEDRVLVKRLPLASAGQLSREVLGGTPTLVSEIYVYS